MPLGCALALGVTTAGLSQESLRTSLAGEEAAAARRKAATSTGYYNLKLGPSAWTFGAALGFEASDNIRLEGLDPKSDFIIRPELSARMVLPVSDFNRLNFAFAGGYSAYVTHSEYSRWFMRPGSELSFDLYVGPIWINFHDRFSILEDNYLDPTVVGSGDYSRLENTVGATAVWDLNKIVLKLGYDHQTYISMADDTGPTTTQPDGSSEVFSFSAGYHIGDGLLAGLEMGGSLINFSQSNTNSYYQDGTEWNVGVFTEATLSEYMTLRASVGYAQFTPSNDNTLSQLSDFNGLYAHVALQHRISKSISYTLSGGRTLNYTLYGGNLDLTSVRLDITWQFIAKTALSTYFVYEHGKQLYYGPETFDRYGPGINISRAITQKLTARAGYQFYSRDSDLAQRSYDVNIGTLSLNYRF